MGVPNLIRKVNSWVSQIYSGTRVQLWVADLIWDILDIVDTITGFSRYLGAVQCITVMPGRHVADLEEDARAGLIERPRSLPPKYFYDARGAELFGRICETPEYYPTRTEDALLRQYGDDIIALARPDYLIELGSGSSKKTTNLFDACEKLGHTCVYAPFDICEPVLLEAAGKLQHDYKWLDVRPLLGDYHAGLVNLPHYRGARMFLFLGGTIGNFTPPELRAFIDDIRRRMEPGDFLLLGADRIKDTTVLHAAYNDAQGITAQFNLNVLQVLNRELDANFRADNFAHLAVYNNELNRIEMYLVSGLRQEITLGKLNESIRLECGEKILTELSYKFCFDELETLLEEVGLNVIRHFEPDNHYFSLVLAQSG